MTIAPPQLAEFPLKATLISAGLLAPFSPSLYIAPPHSAELPENVLPVMVEQKGGVILNTASTVGMNALPGLPPYSASKAGVIQLSNAAAIEYAWHKIRVNAICPSVVDTPLLRHLIASTPDPEAARMGFEQLNPMPGMVTVDAVAKAALFLVSDDSSFITGVALPIDGGYTAR